MVRNYIRKTIKQYSDADMNAALQDVCDGIASAKEIAAKYNIPESTLSEKVNGVHLGRHGHKTDLDDVTERRIAECLMYAAECGWPLNRDDLKQIVMDFCESEHIKTSWSEETGPGKDFLQNFERRWAHLMSKRKTVNLTVARSNLSPEILEKFFELVHCVYEKYKLADKPDSVYDLDETGVCTDPSGSKCFFRRGVKDANILSPTGGKTMFTVLCCGNADGSDLLPPFVVYKAKTLLSTWCQGGPAGTTYSSSTSGWMESLQFENWVAEFMVHKRNRHQNNHIVLFVDGHASHLTHNVIKACLENNVT